MFKCLCLLFFFVSWLSAADFLISEPDSLPAVIKKLQPGDTVVLRNGTWKDANLIIFTSGTAEKPITIRAHTPGQVILTGNSRIALGGKHVVVDGLWFQNPTGEDSIVLRADSKKLASDCRVTNCAVTGDAPAVDPTKSSKFLSIYGSRNRVDHCYLAGKTTVGTTMVVWLAEGLEANHQIDHNHFGPRVRLGQNAGETLRVGDSKTSMFSANCLIENNLFVKCDGEAECISNKSCGNIYRFNHFKEVSGTLTLRHGNNCRVENNLFAGAGAKGTGGVRVIGEDHVVTWNRFQDLTGDRERSAISFMMGVPDSPSNLYFQVKRAIISRNTFSNCRHNIVIGMVGDKKASLPPIETAITNNLIETNLGEPFEVHCEASGITILDNKTGKELSTGVAKIPITEVTGPVWRQP